VGLYILKSIARWGSRDGGHRVAAADAAADAGSGDGGDGEGPSGAGERLDKGVDGCKARERWVHICYRAQAQQVGQGQVKCQVGIGCCRAERKSPPLNFSRIIRDFFQGRNLEI
jgi:hypothetical protein